MDEGEVRNGCVELLEAGGIAVSHEQLTLIERHCALVREWNPHTSLVSRGDVSRLWSAHVADSLSLARLVLRRAGPAARYVDIGSGAGFPAVILKAILPGLRMTLVERSTKRAGFLRKVVGALAFEDVCLVTGEFPREARLEEAQVVTARAVENPGRILRAISEHLPFGAAYFCQSGDPRGVLPATFHVEQIEDIWTERRLRRGPLFLVRRT